MQHPKGFGQSPKPKKHSEGSQRRQAAANQYDGLKSKGFPEFTIYVRLPEKPDTWLPVGSMTVQRSSAISQAIFQNETDLLKGALRLFPRLSKRQQDLEYGYRLKDKLYQDEPIQVAQRPQPTLLQRLQAWLRSKLSLK